MLCYQNVVFFITVIISQFPVKCIYVSDLNITKYKGAYSKNFDFVLNSKIELVLVFPSSSSIYPYRVKAWTTNATSASPVMVVVRQEKEVLSWQVPFIVDTSRNGRQLHFKNTSRTLCHNDMSKIAKTSKSFIFSHKFKNNESCSGLATLYKSSESLLFQLFQKISRILSVGSWRQSLSRKFCLPRMERTFLTKAVIFHNFIFSGNVAS